MAMHVVSPSPRIDPIRVLTHQWPCGAASRARSPRMARPYRRVIFVVTPDSSMKTIFAGSQFCEIRFQSFRSDAMSARSCSAARSVFFYMSDPCAEVYCPPSRWSRKADRRRQSPPRSRRDVSRCICASVPVWFPARPVCGPRGNTDFPRIRCACAG